jgi:hypothetical protein
MEKVALDKLVGVVVFQKFGNNYLMQIKLPKLVPILMV